VTANIVGMWNYEQLVELATLVESGRTLGQISRHLDRPYATVAAQVSRGGLHSKGIKERKLPRGAGYDKASTKLNLISMWRFNGTAQQYARRQKLNLDSLVFACETHFADGWGDYVRNHAPLPQATCGYCERVFHPNSAAQVFCSSKCSIDGRADKAYFNGNRRTTIGMDTGVCQVCERSVKKGLSPHHLFGKENDPEDDALVGLCRGCHQLVTILAQRVFCDDPEKLEHLITLAWLRKHGQQQGAEMFDAHVSFNLSEQLLAA
jgi:hypothetical protein